MGFFSIADPAWTGRGQQWEGPRMAVLCRVCCAHVLPVACCKVEGGLMECDVPSGADVKHGGDAETLEKRAQLAEGV